MVLGLSQNEEDEEVLHASVTTSEAESAILYFLFVTDEAVVMVVSGIVFAVDCFLDFDASCPSWIHHYIGCQRVEQVHPLRTK